MRLDIFSTWKKKRSVAVAMLVAAVAAVGSVDAAFKLQILHSSDNESSFQDPNSLEEKALHYSSLVNGLRQMASGEKIRSIHVTAGDHTIPGPFYQAGEELEPDGIRGLGDIRIYNGLKNAANGIGNHEFDYGIEDFAAMTNRANYPMLAANLDFTGVNTTVPIKIGDDAGSCYDLVGSVAKSCHLWLGKDLTVGLIGRAPYDLFNVVGRSRLKGLEYVGGTDSLNRPLESAVDMVLEQVDLLEKKGAKVIVLLDHAQDFTADPLNAEELRGVDIIVSAGSSGFMANDTPQGPFSLLRAGDQPQNSYPTPQTDREGNTVLVINSDQLYNYIGHLIVEFDDNGNVIGFDEERSGPVATTEESVALLANEVGVDEPFPPIPEVAQTMQELQATPSIQDAFAVAGETVHPLNGERSGSRGRQTNLGDFTADSTMWAATLYATNQSLPVPDVALKNGGGIRDSIAGPKVTRLSIQTALPFNNKQSLIEMNATTFLATMENSVSRVPFNDGRFPQTAGMFMVYNESNPGVESAATLDTPSRIQHLVVSRSDGTEDVVVEDYELMGELSRTFVMACNSYLQTGGDGYLSLFYTTVLGETEIGEQQILEDYLRDELGGTVDIEDPPTNIRVISAWNYTNIGDKNAAGEGVVVTSRSGPTGSSSSSSSSSSSKEGDNKNEGDTAPADTTTTEAAGAVPTLLNEYSGGTSPKAVIMASAVASMIYNLVWFFL